MTVRVAHPGRWREVRWPGDARRSWPPLQPDSRAAIQLPIPIRHLFECLVRQRVSHVHLQHEHGQVTCRVRGQLTTFAMKAFIAASGREVAVIAPQRHALIARLQKCARCGSPVWALPHLDSLSVPAETASDFPLAMTKEDSESSARSRAIACTTCASAAVGFASKPFVVPGAARRVTHLSPGPFLRHARAAIAGFLDRLRRHRRRRRHLACSEVSNLRM